MFNLNIFKRYGGKIRTEKYNASRYTGAMSPHQMIRYFNDPKAEYISDRDSVGLLCANCHAITHDEERERAGLGRYRNTMMPDAALEPLE